MTAPVFPQAEPRTLVFCSAGNRIGSLAWLPELTHFPNFDVALVDYGSGSLSPPTEVRYFLRNKDFKIPNFLQLAREVPVVLGYDLFVFIDDDIVMSAADLALWRTMVVEQRLDVSQPALTLDSKTDWPHVKVQSGFNFDQGQFVEIQCFALSRRALRLALPYFFMVKTGAGLDVALYCLAQRWKLRTGVVHSVQVFHPPRPEDETVRKQFDDFATFNSQMSCFMNFCFEQPELFDDLVTSSRVLGDTRPKSVRWVGVMRFLMARARRVLGRWR